MNLIGIKARKASEYKVTTEVKNKVLNDYAKLIKNEKKFIINQNSKDINYARKKGLKENLIKRLHLNENKLDGIIEEIISNKSNKLGSIFLGGNSQIILDTSIKYSLGINQWLGTNDQFQKKIKLYKEIKKPKGSLSRCVGLNYINHELDFIDYEKIFIFKDTNTEKFLETVDIIFK